MGTEFRYTEGAGQVVTVDDRAGSPDVLEDNRASGHRVVDGGGLVDDGNGIEAESFHYVRAVDEAGNLTGPTIKITVFSQNGQTSNVWGFASDIPLQDGVTYRKIAGSNRGSAEYADFAPCFGPGTELLCEDGQRGIETLEVGARVWTRDHGFRPIRWIGRTAVPGRGRFAPVLFEAGAIGNDRPLTVSPQHRMLVAHEAAELLFGAGEVLVPALHLVGMPGVRRAPCDSVLYTHLMFDRHEIVLANGALVESFFLTERSAQAVAEEARRELLGLFPSLRHGEECFGALAAPALRGAEAAVLRGAMAGGRA